LTLFAKTTKMLALVSDVFFDHPSSKNIKASNNIFSKPRKWLYRSMFIPTYFSDSYSSNSCV